LFLDHHHHHHHHLHLSSIIYHLSSIIYHLSSIIYHLSSSSSSSSSWCSVLSLLNAQCSAHLSTTIGTISEYNFSNLICPCPGSRHKCQVAAGTGTLWWNRHHRLIRHISHWAQSSQIYPARARERVGAGSADCRNDQITNVQYIPCYQIKVGMNSRPKRWTSVIWHWKIGKQHRNWEVNSGCGWLW